MRYLGIDWGEKRIGLSLGDDETRIASPLIVVKNLEEVCRIIKNEGVEAVVVGRPLSIINYRLSIANKDYNNFLKKLEDKNNLPIYEIDERLSSKAADALTGGKYRNSERDMVAAMVILQSFFDQMDAGKYFKQVS